ncbi:single-stranded DNA-binding protein [Aerococcus sp. UMB8608]|uniref:Single-stranded DNA-binding protein n=1 Tax=Aerococcus sanguinicola TaxID=119206 RepID=A0A0X8F9J6_9LACT|nr:MULTISPECIES: single-stranded DNA-binding protein [Aerococcus]AMB93269.1 single-stranded DNA-binding protein [Aerococcus sanguinicola]MDK6679368.1 single-stranded DNA-binding protein [Aerococcus sp. UMB8608]MDK6685790.1 single-stranded DNA-binding protein [Aerococcus sp. UMB8623]OFT95901.1 single-stranded DNA-binding protein [Aerococcus sp. HMSC23C02]
MINNVVLVGRLTKEVDLRYTQSGIAAANFILACNRNFRNAQGEIEADFISCVIWRKAAENLAKYARKGSLIGVEGTIQTRNYENQQGQRVYVTEVLVNHFSLLEPKSTPGEQPQGTGQQQDPFAIAGASSNVNVADDDLPF